MCKTTLFTKWEQTWCLFEHQICSCHIAFITISSVAKDEWYFFLQLGSQLHRDPKQSSGEQAKKNVLASQNLEAEPSSQGKVVTNFKVQTSSKQNGICTISCQCALYSLRLSLPFFEFK